MISFRCPIPSPKRRRRDIIFASLLDFRRVVADFFVVRRCSVESKGFTWEFGWVFGGPVRVSIDTFGAIPLDLRMRRAGIFDRGDKVHTGDRDFDLAVDVFGDTVEVQALFDQNTRDLAGAMAESGVVAGSGRVELHDTTRAIYDVDSAVTVEMVIRKMVTLARRLRTLTTIFSPKDRLYRIATTDECEGVRSRALATLIQYFPWSAETEKAARSVPKSEKVELRFQAAYLLTAQRPAIWRPLADLCYEPNVTNFRRKQALKRLFVVAPQDAALRLLQAAVNTPLLRVTALEAANHVGLEPGAPLIKQLLRESDGPLRLVSIASILKFNYEQLASELIPFVDPGDHPLAMAAAQALGEIGGLDAVETLHEVSNRFLIDGQSSACNQRGHRKDSGSYPGGSGSAFCYVSN